MPVSTFYPDAHPETTSVDGYIGLNTTQDTWAGRRDRSAGDLTSDSNTRLIASLTAGTTTDLWTEIYRAFMLFDTASIPDGDTIDLATCELYGRVRDNTNFSQSAALVTSTPASNTAIVLDDFDQLGTVDQAARITFANWITTGFNVFTLNATGRGNISKTGVTKFGLRGSSDADNSPPTWVSAGLCEVHAWPADEDQEGDLRPKLVVTHAPPRAPFLMVF